MSGGILLPHSSATAPERIHKVYKAPGPDGVSNDMLKRLGPRGRRCILDIVNSSWASGEVPTQFKKATIVPIAKRGKPPGQIGS